MNSNPNRLPMLINLSTQERFTLDGPSVSIGRLTSNNVVLANDEYASAKHARIFWSEGGWWVEDLQSSNGTAVNDQIITGPYKLAPGNVLKVGRTKFRID